MCAGHRLLPISLQCELSGNTGDDVQYYGRFADVLKGEHRGREVAVKVLRGRNRSSHDIANASHSFWGSYLAGVIGELNTKQPLQGFCKEVVTWRSLQHPNVLPLLGAIMTEGRFAMVSEWMTNGNINKFISENQSANRFELVG